MARVDTKPRGLLVPAWRHELAPGAWCVPLVASGRYQGMTVGDVAKACRMSPAEARDLLLAGLEPEPGAVRAQKRKEHAARVAKRKADDRRRVKMQRYLARVKPEIRRYYEEVLTPSERQFTLGELGKKYGLAQTTMYMRALKGTPPDRPKHTRGRKPKPATQAPAASPFSHIRLVT